MNEAAPEFGLAATTVARLREVLTRHPHVQRAVLYGSRAKGCQRVGSDIDLALEGDELTLIDILRIEGELDDLMLPYRIDLADLAAINNPALRQHIQRVGVVFYPNKAWRQ
jgi:predicted nucleotidyltransferase